jgi:uncharacterized protein with PQ loop repeat
MEGPSRRRKIILSIVYWIAVLVVSLAILVGLILLLESRDSSSINGGSWISAVSSLLPT